MQKYHARALTKVESKVSSTRFIRSKSEKRERSVVDKEKKVLKYLSAWNLKSDPEPEEKSIKSELSVE